MPKILKQAYIGKELVNPKNPRGMVPLPAERFIGWAMRRFVQLKLRYRFKVTNWRKPLLLQKIQAYFNNMGMDDMRDGIEGHYFWVTDRRTPHMGPCAFCQEKEEKYRHTGAPFHLLEQIMISQPCLSWHWNSRLGPGITYSRILPLKEANEFGIGIYGSQSPEGIPESEGVFRLTDKMKKDIAEICTNHVGENKIMATRLALNQVGREALNRKEQGLSVAGIETVGIA